MTSINGIGTTLYGKREINYLDNSYIATKWFIFLFLPIAPIASYRVIKEQQKFLTLQAPRYQMIKVNLNARQVVNTYLASWGIIFAAIILASIFG